MNTILRQFQQSTLVHVCLAIVFFTSGVLVNAVQCTLYLVLHPINKTLYRKVNWYLCATVYAQLVFLGDWWSGSKVVFYIDRKEFDQFHGKEHAYCVMNHSYEIDWLIGWMICNRIRCLGNCKAYAKKSIQYIPVLGWAWKCAEFVFLERSFDKDKATIHHQIKQLAEHPDPIWLLLFPEGTRFTAAKHKASLEFARQHNLPLLERHLLPRTKGFTASLEPMKGQIPAVYDIEIAFQVNDPNAPTISNLLNGKGVTAHMYMRRLPLDSLPNDQSEQETYLREMFVRKDRLLDSFLTTGDFFKTSGVEPIPAFQVERRWNSLINQIIWSLTVLVPLFYYLSQCAINGRIVPLSVCVCIIGSFYLLMHKTIGMSEIKRGSSYGAATAPSK